MTTSSIVILGKFKTNLISFLDEMIDSFNLPELIIFRVGITTAPIDQIMGEFIRNVLPYKQYAKDRDIAFYTHIVKGCDPRLKDSIASVQRILTSGSVDDDTKNVIWSWFDQFIKLSQAYKDTREKELLE
jgi:hypothetical protein